MYALRLAEDGRILEIMDIRYQTDKTPIVESYPKEFNVTVSAYDYRYVNGEWIFDPLKKEPTEEEDMASLLIDHEYRLTLLELGITE